MGKGGLKKFEVVMRRNQVFFFYQQARSVSWIAEKLKISESQVYKDLQSEYEELRFGKKPDKEFYLAETIAKSYVIEQTAWDCFHKSQEPNKTTKQEVSQKATKSKKGKSKLAQQDEKAINNDANPAAEGDDAVQSVKKSEEIRHNVGNPAFLREVSYQVNFRAELMGLKKVNDDMPENITVKIEA